MNQDIIILTVALVVVIGLITWSWYMEDKRISKMITLIKQIQQTISDKSKQAPK